MAKPLDEARIRAVVIALLFLMSGVGASVLINPASAAPNSSSPSAAAPVSAASPLTQAEANWAATNGNAFNWDYNPQNQINSSNIQNLGLNWLFPLPIHPTALLDVAGGLGVDTAPLIINGTVYFITQAMQIFALNAANGNVLWTTVLPIFPNSTASHGVTLSLHTHDGDVAFTTSLFNHTPTFWLSASDQKVYALNALTGKIILNFTDFTGCVTIAGNNPNCVEGGTPTNLLVDQQRGIVITSVMSGSAANTGRCMYRGWNILVNPPTLMWTAFCTPPQPGGNLPLNPNWDAQQIATMKNALIFKGAGPDSPGGYGGANTIVDLKALSPAVLNSTLYDDWGYVNQSPACAAADAGGSTGSTAAGWGGPWILGTGPSAGLAFVDTNNRDPYTSACMNGPDLWSASVLAINETTGQWVWGLQSGPHELWDYDCSWWQGIGNETINGVNTQVVWKSCKAGYMFELNAVTGAFIWSWTPPTSILPRCHFCYYLDPLNRTEMTRAFMNPNLQPTIMYPWAVTFESVSAYSPVTNYIYTVSNNVPIYLVYIPLNATNYKTNPGFAFLPVPGGYCAAHPGACTYGFAGPNTNATVEAIDTATGQMAWSHFIPAQGYRGGMTVSGNILYLTLSSGDVIMLNAQTGALLKDYYIGGPLNVLSSIGATATGQEEIIVPITAGLVSWATGIPGDIVALTLQPQPTGSSGQTTTTTVTASGAPGATTTVTTTSISTSLTGGVSSTTLYGVAAVAVIFIIATGYLAMSRRKPAS
ncbi:MAG: PQQ-binding-like beta-propeller repeat protein [Thaumarchaeota archaeon]|nr:PQQ-binding-like beta-propeller repeat protein [Nitrososphaerota archaeon]